MEYSFDVKMAEKYGVDEAILIRHFVFWISKNKANGVNLHEGRTWTYTPLKDFPQIFPFWTLKQARGVRDSVIRQKIIIKGCFNRRGYDRTSWYAFRNEKAFVRLGKSICPKRQMDLPEPANAFAGNGTPIPVITTNPNPSNTDKLTQIQNQAKNSPGLLDLDLKTVKDFRDKVTELLPPRTKPEAVTFGRALAHIVGLVKTRSLEVSIFRDVIKWAEDAAKADVTNQRGLFIKKIKKETGFKKTTMLLGDSLNPVEMASRAGTQLNFEEKKRRMIRDLNRAASPGSQVTG